MSTAARFAILEPGATLVHVPGVCADPYFNAAADQELVWLPSKGMGYLPVNESPYDADYWQKYVGYAATEQGRRITAARCALVDKYMGPHETLIDVGIGCGDFIDSCKQQALGFDINPVAVKWLETRGIFADPYRHAVHALTFWDAIEHVPDAHRMLANAKRWAFASLPIVPGDGPPPRDWKHLRPDEHCWYWTRRGFISWMSAQGFECVECHAGETLLGRDDIETFVMRRR